MLRRLIDFIYPALCRHCEATIHMSSHLLCSACTEHLVLADPSHRCRLCFCFVQGRPICSECAEHPILYKKSAATCENEGPARTLLFQYRHHSPQLFKALGSLMAMQVIQLNWTLPDLIVPIPSARMKGFDCNELLAEQMGKILERPTKKVLKTTFSLQAWLAETAVLSVKKTSQMTDQRLLLVMDRFEREKVRAASSALCNAFPLEINVISFC